MSADKPNLNDILLLLTVPNFGPGRVRRLLSVFGTTNAIFKAPAQRLMQVDGIDRKLIEQIKRGGDQKKADQQLELIKKHRINVLTVWDSAYPNLLKKTADPPLVLFYRGQLPEKIRTKCRETDQPSAALVTDLKQRGLLKDPPGRCLHLW